MPSPKQLENERYASKQMRDYWDRPLFASECEISYLVRPRSVAFQSWEKSYCYPGLSLHHIAGRTGGRPMQAWSNFVIASNAVHSFNHDGFADGYSVKSAIECCCLLSKSRLQVEMQDGPVMWRETESHRQHFDIAALDEIRRACVSHKSLVSRVAFLLDDLTGTPFQDLAKQLAEIVL